MESWVKKEDHPISQCLLDQIKGNSHFQVKEMITNTLKNEEDHLNSSGGACTLQEFSNKVSDVIKYPVHILYLKDNRVTDGLFSVNRRG